MEHSFREKIGYLKEILKKETIEFDEYREAAGLVEELKTEGLKIMSDLGSLRNCIIIYKRKLKELKEILSEKPVNHENAFNLAAECEYYIARIQERLAALIRDGNIKI